MKFLCALCALCGLAFPAAALDREAFTFTNYNLEARVEPEQQRLGVRGRITLRNDSAVAQKNLVLQVSSTLAWKSIQIGGKAVHFETHELTSDIDHTGALSEAVVTLPHEVLPKGTIELDIGYEGVIRLDTTRLTRIGVPEDKAKHSDWDQIGRPFTAVRGIGYVAWYPVATEAAILADGNSVPEAVGRWRQREAQESLILKLSYSRESAEPPPTLLCSGEVTNQNIEEMSRAQLLSGQCSFSSLGLAAPTFVIAGYQELTPKDLLTIYYLPHQQEAAEAYGEIAAQIDPLFPVGRSSGNLQILDLPDPDAASFVTEGMLLTPLNSPMTNQAELSIVYAKARQLVSSPRAWIQEGLAHYAQVAFVEEHKGLQAVLDYLNGHMAALVDAEKAAKAASTPETTHSLINAPDDLYLQAKAMCVWWMLKDMLGNLPNDALLRYHANQDTDPTYMPRLIAGSTKRDLQWFFEDWVYHDRGLPDFRVASVFSSPLENGHFLVTITVENLGRAGAEVPVALRIEGGEVRQRVEVRGQAKASLRIEASSKPLEIVINDGSVPESDTSNNTYKISQ